MVRGWRPGGIQLDLKCCVVFYFSFGRKTRPQRLIPRRDQLLLGGCPSDPHTGDRTGGTWRRTKSQWVGKMLIGVGYGLGSGQKVRRVP